MGNDWCGTAGINIKQIVGTFAAPREGSLFSTARVGVGSENKGGGSGTSRRHLPHAHFP